MLVFFTNLSLMEFRVRYLPLFLLFSVIDGFDWLWVGSLRKNIELMLEFLKGPFLVLHFSYYTLTTFLMMLSVILSSMLMILLSILSVIRHLICGENLNWLLNLNLIYETLWTVLGEKSSFILGLTFSSQLDWGSYISLLLKLQENWSLYSFYEVSFLLRLLCISINLPYAHVWNTVVTSGLVPQVATWNC